MLVYTDYCYRRIEDRRELPVPVLIPAPTLPLSHAAGFARNWAALLAGSAMACVLSTAAYACEPYSQPMFDNPVDTRALDRGESDVDRKPDLGYQYGYRNPSWRPPAPRAVVDPYGHPPMRGFGTNIRVLDDFENLRPY